MLSRKRRSLAFTSAILAVTLAVVPLNRATSQTLQDEREAFDYARVLFSDGLFDTAAEEYRRFILNYPTSERVAQARLKLGDAYFQASAFVEAVAAYQSFVDRHPDHLEVAAALRNRATALQELSEHSRAAEAFSELYDRFRTGEYAVQDLLSSGTNAMAANDAVVAEQALRKILTNHPSSPLLMEAVYNLGLVLRDQERKSEALAQFESIAKSEREPDALLEIGRIALSLDNLSKAERTFDTLRKQFPRNRSAQESYLVLGSWFEQNGQWPQALAIYEKARDANLDAKHQQKIILGLARVYGETDRDALQLYAQFLKVYPSSDLLPDARLGLGRAYQDKEQYRQAISAFKRLQEAFPDHAFSVTAYQHIGDVYAAIGSPRRALAAYSQHLTRSQNDDESAATRLSMSKVYLEQLGWTDRAVKILSELASLSRVAIAGAAQFQLGQAREAADEPHLAIREYRDYLERFAGQPDAREAERRIRYLSTYAPAATLDEELTQLVGSLSTDTASKLRIGQMLHNRRHFDQAIPYLESAAADTASSDAHAAAYYLAEALLSIDRRESIVNGGQAAFTERAKGLYRQLATDARGPYADDARLRSIELEATQGDSTATENAIAGYEQFAKQFPNSDRLSDAKLQAADAHLSLSRKDPGRVDRALALYQEVARSGRDPDASERAEYGRGRCLAIKKDYVNAENALRDFLFAYPNSVLSEEAKFQLGLILLERGYLQSASAEFAELLKAPTSVELEKNSRALLAECYFRLEDFKRAAEIDETLLAREADPAVLRRLGEAYSRLEENEKAIRVLGTYARKFQSESGADTLSFRRAELLAQMGRTGQAIEAFSSLASAFPKSALKPQAQESIARLQFQMGDYQKALAALSGAGSRQEAIAELRILSLLRLDRTKEARGEVKAFKKAFPASKESLARFDVEEARVQLRYGNPKGARNTLAGVSKAYPDTRSAVDAEFYLIEAIEEVGKPEEHLAALVSFIRKRKDNENWARANLAMAEIHDKEQDYVGASRAYLNALSGQLTEEERPVVLDELYKAHRNLRSYDTAISYAHELVSQYPSHALAGAARIQIGEMYSEKGNHIQAIDELRPLLTKLQGDAWSSAQLVIANSYQALGQYENALREWLKMVYNPQGSVNWLANAFMGRAQCFRALKRYNEALQELEKITARFAGTSFVLQAEQIRQEILIQMQAQQ